jgi:iron complex outermembrane receptor protein
MFGTNIRSQSSYQRVFDSKIVGFPFSLPAGKVGLSLGAEYRVEGFAAIDSPEIFLGSTPVSDINVKRNITSFYGEVSVPIVSSAMNVPFVYNLEMNGAFRHDHYKGVNPDANVPKITLRWQPTPDMTIRATYSASFIAPTLFQTNGPNLEAFTAAINLGQGAEQAQILSGSNTALAQSTAETYTAGIVYSPKFIPGLTVSIDAFRTLQVNIIGAIPSATILTDVENLGPGSPFAPLVAFNAFPGRAGARPVTAPHQLAGNLNTVFIVDTNQNLGGSRTEGFDLSLRYNMDLGVAGQLELGVSALLLTNYDLKNLPIHDTYYNVTGLVGGEFFGAIPDYRINFLAEYRWRGFTLSANANYIPEMLNTVVNDPAGDQSTFDPVDDYFTVDARLSYTFKGRTTTTAAETKDAKDSKNAAPVAGTETMSPVQKLLDGLTLTVGCNNMFDVDPPFISGANSNSDLSVYDPYGRFVYFEISKKF